ncbi:peptidase inhibitor family I36 protein [Streptomyces longispororuber]|uniref:peptidase inhibitor family I36 protein n=1 Tax=Streptomyces longispororuber TaxID=68230 RepID=UPI00340247BB
MTTTGRWTRKWATAATLAAAGLVLSTGAASAEATDTNAAAEVKDAGTAVPGAGAESRDGVKMPPAAAGNFILYKDDNFKGGSHTFTRADDNFNDNKWSSSGKVDNSASSMRNNYRQYMYLFQHVGCSGMRYVAEPTSYDAKLSKNTGPGQPVEFNNRASCLRFGHH